jgi:hypothetical protein
MSVSPRNQTYYYSDQWHLQTSEVRMVSEQQEQMQSMEACIADSSTSDVLPCNPLPLFTNWWGGEKMEEIVAAPI